MIITTKSGEMINVEASLAHDQDMEALRSLGYALLENLKERDEQLTITQNLLASHACSTGAGANDPDVHEALMFNI